MSLSKRKALKRLSTAMSSDLKSSSGTGDIIRQLRPSSTPPPLPEPKFPASKTDNPPRPKKPPASSLSSLFQSSATKKIAEASDLGGEGIGKLRGRFSEVFVLKEIGKSVGVDGRPGWESSLAQDNPSHPESVAWITKEPPFTVVQRAKEMSRFRKTLRMPEAKQDYRFSEVMTMVARKVGTVSTLALLDRMGMKPAEQDFNALIGICVEKARHAVDDEEALDQIYKAYQLLRLMKEKGLSLSEGSYGPCLAFLVDMEMEQDFLFFSKWIKYESPEASPRIGYYEMLFLIKVNDHERILDLCNNVERSFVAENYLAALSENDRAEETLKLLEVVGITRISSKTLMTSLFESFGRSSNKCDAVGFLLKLRSLEDWIQDLSLLIFNYATNLTNFAVEEIVSKFKELHGIMEIQPSEISITYLIAYCCRYLEVHVALDVVNYMSQSGLNVFVETFHPILQASEQSCYPYLVHPIYLAMCKHSVSLNEETIRSMISMHVKMKDFEGAYNMLQIMKEAGQKPTTKLYNTIMAGYFREGNKSSAMMVLKQMKEANVDPDSGTYFYLIFNSKTEKEIEKYRKELELYSVSMTKYIRMALVHAYAKYGLFDKAKEIVLYERGIKHRNDAKSALILALASNGRVLEAMEIYENLKKLREHIEPKAICCLIDHLRKHENFDKLVELLGELKDTSFWFDGCARIAIYCVQKKDLRSIVGFLMQLKDKYENSIHAFFDKLYIELANSKSIDMAFGLNLLNAMKENLNVLPSRTNLDTLLTACLSMKDSNSAWLVWEEYKKTKLPYNILSYLRMYQVLLACGDRKSAAGMLKKMSKDDPHICFIIEKTQKTFC